MADKQIVDSFPNVHVEFIKNDVHTGEEHRTSGYRLGETATLPRAIVDLLVTRGLVKILDEHVSAIKAIKRGKEADEKNKQATNKKIAQAVMLGYDDLPPELRALVRERGDDILFDVIALVQAGEKTDDIVRAYGG